MNKTINLLALAIAVVNVVYKLFTCIECEESIFSIKMPGWGGWMRRGSDGSYH